MQGRIANLLTKENAFIPVTVAIIWYLQLQVLHARKATGRMSLGSDPESAETEPEGSQERQLSPSQVLPWVESTGALSSLHGRFLGIKH